MKKLLLLGLLVFLSSSACLFAQFSGGGNGSESSPFGIKTAEDLSNIRNYIGNNHKDKHFRILNDIDLSEYLKSTTKGWEPIKDASSSSFTGYLHGGGFAVKGLWIARSDESNAALFRSNSGTIDSLSIRIGDKKIVGANGTAALVGYNSSDGVIYYCSVRNSEVVPSGNWCGGLIGSNSGKVEYCYSMVNVKSEANYAGGLIGDNRGTVSRSYSTGTVSGHSNIGGLVGENSGNIENCYSKSNVSATSNSGGLIGYNSTSSYRTVLNSYSLGKVTGTKAGAFIGYNSTASHSSTVGCYYNTDTAGATSAIGDGSSYGISGINTNAMKYKVSFTNWNFHDVWSINEANSYPFLLNIDQDDHPNIIHGKGIACMSSLEIYSVNSTANGYNWSVEQGTIISGQGTSRIIVKWNEGSNTEGKVVMTNNLGQSTRSINLVESPKPTISGDFNPEAGSETYYETDRSSSSYAWDIVGGVITSGEGTYQVRVKWDCQPINNASISVNYTNANGCTASTPKIERVIFKEQSPNSIIGNFNPDAGTKSRYSASSPIGSNFSWTIVGGVITSGRGTWNIEVLWDCEVTSKGASIAYSFKTTKGCEISVPAQSVHLKEFSLEDNHIAGEKKPDLGGEYTYSVASGYQSYDWKIEGGTIVSNNGSGSISVIWSSTNGLLNVEIKTSSGCLFSPPPLPIETQHAFGGGNGTKESPFKIYTAEQLAKINKFPGYHFMLMADIDLVEYIKNTDSNKGWEGLLNKGSFDGNYHTISGLWMDDPDKASMGLFLSNQTNSTIEKLYLRLDSRGIKGGSSVGGICGINHGTLHQVALIDGSVFGEKDNVGAICGYNYGTVTESYTTNSSSWGRDNIGGLIGHSSKNGVINFCYSDADVVGHDYVGGLVGFATGESESLKTKIHQSYSSGAVSGGTYEGGFMGGISSTFASITGSFYDKNKSRQQHALGHLSDHGYNVSGYTTQEMMKKANYLAWDFRNIWKIDEGISYPYFIWTENEPSSINENSVNSISLTLSPNPTEGIAFVRLDSDVTISEIVVCDLYGKVALYNAYDVNSGAIDLTNLPSGLYLVKLMTNEGLLISRIIKK